MISIIVAISEDWGIGKNNELLWHIPEDLKRFRKLTMGQCIIMGKKTWESLPKKPLPGRTNIVITHKKSLQLCDSIVMHSLEDAIKYCVTLHEEEVFIVGGGEIFKQSQDLVNRIYITLIDTYVKGDTYYPQIDFSNWDIISEIPNKADEKNPFDYTYYILQRPAYK